MKLQNILKKKKKITKYNVCYHVNESEITRISDKHTLVFAF